MVDEYAPIDTVVPESIAKRYRTDESVSAVELALGDIDGHQGLTITFDPEHYPDRVGNARLDVQWYRNDGFNFHHVETHANGGIWQCRWDRQRNPHSDRAHFYPPPDAGDPIDVECPDDYRDVLSTIRVVIHDRVEARAAMLFDIVLPGVERLSS